MSDTTTRHEVGSVEAIPLGEARVIAVNGRNLAVYRCRDGTVYATDAECPHRGGPLADGLLGEHSVICPLHGFAFDLRTGEAPGRECPRLVTHRITVRGGTLSLELA